MKKLENKIAIITGAAKGMGREEAILYANEGAKIVVTDILIDEAKIVANEIIKNNGEAIAFKLDVAKAKDWEKLIDQIMDRWGKVDILVNNAGILNLCGIEEITEKEWDKIMEINAKGTFLGIKYVLPAMKLTKNGSIINISSIYGLVGSGAAVAYHASKGAVRLLTKTVAAELAKYNIRVNSIHPGVIKTPMTDDLLKNPENAKNLLGTTVLGRAAEPIEVAYGALFLASDDASYVTGSELVIDGGYTAL